MVALVGFCLLQTAILSPYWEALAQDGTQVLSSRNELRRTLVSESNRIDVHLLLSEGQVRTAELTATYWPAWTPGDRLLREILRSEGHAELDAYVGAEGVVVVQMPIQREAGIRPHGLVERVADLRSRVVKMQEYVKPDPRGAPRPMDLARKIEVLTQRDLAALADRWNWPDSTRPMAFSSPTWISARRVVGAELVFSTAHPGQGQPWIVQVHGYSIDAKPRALRIDLSRGLSLGEFKRRVERFAASLAPKKEG